jgi:phage terminase large subunit
MTLVQVPHNWKPRPYQMPAWLAWRRGIKRSILIWHRRAGKDEISLHKAAVSGLLRPANYWHCLPQYDQARRAIWEAVNPHSGRKRIDEAFPHEIRKSTRQDNMTIEFKSGAVWRIVGSDNPDSLVGAPPAGIVFSEWALSNPSAWALLAPILEENNGWADFITTPRGRNHAKSMLDMARHSPDWFAQVLTVHDTARINAEYRDRDGKPDPKPPPMSLESVERQRKEYHSIFGVDQGDALIEQEYFCSFEAAILGAYYGREMRILEQDGRIVRGLDHDEEAPVHTAWDLGLSAGDAMSIWFFQATAGQLVVLDHIHGHSYGIEHYANEIDRRARERGYERGFDFVPHDARQRELTSSGKDGKAKQRIEVMIECGMKPKVIRNHLVQDGISAARQLLKRTWFDEEKCAHGIECLRQYQAEWDDDLKSFKKTPLANWAAHGADAFRYIAMAYRELNPSVEKEVGRTLMIGVPNPHQVTLDDMWKLNRPQRNQRI